MKDDTRKLISRLLTDELDGVSRALRHMRREWPKPLCAEDEAEIARIEGLLVQLNAAAVDFVDHCRRIDATGAITRKRGRFVGKKEATAG